MNYILRDATAVRNQLLPFTFTRPVADIRIGIQTIREKWEDYLNAKTTTDTQAYLSKKFPLSIAEVNIVINAAYLPTTELTTLIEALKPGEVLIFEEDIIAYCSDKIEASDEMHSFTKKECPAEAIFKLEHSWDLFSQNGKAIIEDFQRIIKDRQSASLPDHIFCVNEEHIFLEEGARVQPGSVLNASSGPIYLGKDSEVMEGSLIRGPFCLGEHATVKMGAKIYGPTTIGPHSKIGGEVNNSILMGYSNKGHDGFLGNSVIGEWCNLGADTNTSNLKNNYAAVKLWDYDRAEMISTGQQFCGLMMGDHSKCGINTMFNTGTTVGVAANIFDGGFPDNHIPSFSWGGSNGFTTYRLDKAFETITTVMHRRGKDFDKQEKEIIKYLFELTQEHRTLAGF